jgi:hypothetical protein
MNLPAGARPSMTHSRALALVMVERMIWAPPIFCSSFAGSCVLVSM